MAFAFNPPAEHPPLPSQTYVRDTLWPERALVAAVLRMALDDLLLPKPFMAGRVVDPEAERARLRAAALAWITDDDESWVYSFRSCCAILGLNPDGVRAKLAGRVAA